VRSLGWRFRAGALITVGALAVHDLRYLVAFRGQAGNELTVQGHDYLGFVTPLVAGLLALAMAGFALRLARAFGVDPGAGPGLPSTRRLWAAASALLLAIYASQEWIEGQLASGHPGGLAAVFGDGGWAAVPLALAVGLLIALVLRGAAAALELASRRAPSRAMRVRALVGLAVPASWLPFASSALARSLAPRGPPPASV
jgi:hypothetical protein